MIKHQGRVLFELTKRFGLLIVKLHPSQLTSTPYKSDLVSGLPNPRNPTPQAILSENDENLTKNALAVISL